MAEAATEAFKRGMEKYTDDGPFRDPVVRCDKCHKLLLTKSIKNLGMCEHCGNRRVKKVSIFNEEEMAQVVGWGVDPDWIALFGPKEAISHV